MSDEKQAAFSIGANAIQAMMDPSGLVGPDGRIKSNLSLNSDGIKIDLPVALFPFLKPQIACIVTLSVVQVAPADPPPPALLIPGVK